MVHKFRIPFYKCERNFILHFSFFISPPSLFPKPFFFLFLLDVLFFLLFVSRVDYFIVGEWNKTYFIFRVSKSTLKYFISQQRGLGTLVVKMGDFSLINFLNQNKFIFSNFEILILFKFWIFSNFQILSFFKFSNFEFFQILKFWFNFNFEFFQVLKFWFYLNFKILILF